MDLILLTVYEVAYLMDMTPRQIYGALSCGYLSGCKITGPSAHASWRIAIESARKFYERIYNCGDTSSANPATNPGCRRFDSRLADLQKFLLQNPELPPSMEGRGGRVATFEGRSNRLDRKEHGKQLNYIQLELFTEEELFQGGN